MMDNETAVTINVAARTMVAFDRNVAVPRGPNAAWLPMPPKAPAISVPCELCKRTIKINATAISR